ncbi:hypothetical protein LDENG_00125910, partial [Lucifuga dentata]
SLSEFHQALLVQPSLHGQAPSYIRDLLTYYKPDCHLRSSGKNLLVVPRFCHVSKGDRAFSVPAPRLWNSLPEDLRLAN